MTNNTSLEQSLLAYRVIHTPTELSWKQHWVQETFTHDILRDCTDEEKHQFSNRLKECNIMMCPINMPGGKEGTACTLQDLVDTITDPNNKNIEKTRRKVVFSTDLIRPVGEKNAYELWNGFQVIDMDIKDRNKALGLKYGLFDRLKKYNWFLGVVLSSSGKGLHIYTKIQIAQDEQSDFNKKKLLYRTNFRHKFSFVYLACLKLMNDLNFDKADLLSGNGLAHTNDKPWLDLSMFKPQQGAFVPYDEKPLINTHFFEDFIYVNFDNVEDMGHPDVDWVTYPDLKEVFKRWEWFEDEQDKDTNIEVKDAPELIVDTHNKQHYKHFERWRLANTLVKLYGQEQGYKYLRMICSNNIKDKELQSDCITAARHQKPVDVWAVNRLNTQHGFNIKLNVAHEEVDIQELYSSIDNIDNPTLIKESIHTKTYHIKKNEYLGTIKWQLLQDIGRITLIEAGAGVGKTEMVKSLAKEGKRIMMVMPFTSTIKSKVENVEGWDYVYGNKSVRLGSSNSIALTIDKFSRLNLMDVKESGFDYIFLDESHLMFQSEYRPVMPKVIEMIRNTEVPIIMMSGTPVGETVFFENLVHLRVIKEDVRKKEFHICIADKPEDVMYHMCKSMARDIVAGKRILFPTNKGTIYKEQIRATVQFMLEKEFFSFEPVVLNYYKKSNVGEEFMDDINFEKTIKNTQILMCSNYLSVGVDILDKYEFSVYFNDVWMPQEIEQFANRLRSNDLFIYLYVASNDSDGNSRNISKYTPMNLRLNDDELADCHSIIQICNSMIKRNPIEYRYNSLVANMLSNTKYIEYNEVENKYYLNEIAFKTIFFERKYREYVQQLPVLAKGMVAYGYHYSSVNLGPFTTTFKEDFVELEEARKGALHNQKQLNTQHIEELMDYITEDRLNIYKDVVAGKYDIRKGNSWRENTEDKIMYVKNIEVFEKVVPYFTSMSKRFRVEDIKSIFECCRNADRTFNFEAIWRIKTLINIIYNNEKDKLDIPIKKFMEESNRFAEKGKVDKGELTRFINDFSCEYAHSESNNSIKIWMSPITMRSISDTFMKIFKCLVDVSRPKKGKVALKKNELLWKTKDQFYNTDEFNSNIYMLEEFINASIEQDVVLDEKPKFENEDIMREIEDDYVNITGSTSIQNIVEPEDLPF